MKQTIPKTLFSFTLHFLRPFKFQVFFCCFLSFLAGFWGPINSLLIKWLINSLPSFNNEISTLMWPALLIVINFIVIDNFTWRGIGYIWAKYVPIIQNKIIEETLEYSLSHSYGFYQNNLSGKLSKLITSLVDGLTTIITQVTANFLRGFSLVLMALIAAYFANPIFSIILLVWFVCFSIFSILMSKKLVFFADQQAAEESKVVGELVDSLSNHQNIRIFSRNMYENLRLKPFLSNQQKAYTKTQLYANLLSIIQGSLIAIMIASAAFFLVYLYSIGNVTVGDFALVLGLSLDTAYMMWFTMSQVDRLNEAVGRCKQTMISLFVPIEITDKPEAKNLKCQFGDILFNEVHFQYAGAEKIFENKCIHINAGQKVGLVGYSGSGKSTFVNLILRFYDINSGSIKIDGQDIKNVTLDSLRESIALIPQDPSLFQRSLMDNIRYGNIQASDQQVIEAAKKAHAHEFINALPEGYNSLVGERGVKLSGGQRQRIAIARAILKNAPILVLDEATSQLDSLTEKIIQDSLWRLMQGKTTIVIAHRLSTLLQMDRILVFDKGKIIQDGTHDQLLSQEGLYKQLWNAQVGGFIGDQF